LLTGDFCAPKFIAMKLADWLAREGLSQVAFARRLNVTRASVSNWCLGERTPQRRYREAIRRETDGLVTANDFDDLVEGVAE
jgi:transcriptional regulator with XRE-family HTH domain